VVPWSPLESSAGTSCSARRLRSDIRASLMAIRVNQVEKEDFPSNFCKWTNAFRKFPGQCLRHLPELVCNETRVQKSFAGDAWRDFQNPVHLHSWRLPRVPRPQRHHRRKQRPVCHLVSKLTQHDASPVQWAHALEPVRLPLLKLRANHSPNPGLRKSLIFGGTSAWKSKKSKKSEKSKISNRHRRRPQVARLPPAKVGCQLPERHRARNTMQRIRRHCFACGQ